MYRFAEYVYVNLSLTRLFSHSVDQDTLVWKRSMPGEHGVDEFAESADDVGIIGDGLDDG